MANSGERKKPTRWYRNTNAHHEVSEAYGGVFYLDILYL